MKAFITSDNEDYRNPTTYTISYNPDYDEIHIKDNPTGVIFRLKYEAIVETMRKIDELKLRNKGTGK